MYNSPSDQRKWLRDTGLIVMTVASTFLAVFGTLWGFEVKKDFMALGAYATFPFIGFGLLMLLVGLFFPRDIKSDNHSFRLATLDECAVIRAFAEDHLGPVFPSVQELRALMGINPKICYVIEAKHDLVPTPVIVGCFSIVPLKQSAVTALELGQLAGSGLKEGHICRKGGSPRGFYVGTVIGKDLAAKGFALKKLAEELDQRCQKIETRKVFSRPITQDGLRVLTKHKFSTVVLGGPPVMNHVCMKVWKPRS